MRASSEVTVNRPIPVTSGRGAMLRAAALIRSTTALAWAEPARSAAAHTPGKPADGHAITIAQIVALAASHRRANQDVG